MSSFDTEVPIPPALIEALLAADSLGVITGAGISVASGIRPYRGQGGVYDDPEEGDRIVNALTDETLATDPDTTWRVLAQLAAQSRAAVPNPAHVALVTLERRFSRFVLLTQNVDGLHQRAGSKNLIDIHGSVFAMRCLECIAHDHLAEPERVTETPRCRYCAGPMRPGVVLFNESLPSHKLDRIQEEFIDDPPEITLAIGTTALFPYIAQPFVLAHGMGRITVEINPEPTLLSRHATFVLRGPSHFVLPRLVESLGAN